MERFNHELVLTTSQAGDVLSVHPSTVKRWCDEGTLPSSRTAGGHRRIHLQDVLEEASDRGIDTYLNRFTPYQAHVWSAVSEAENRGTFRKVHSLAMGWLLRGYLHRVGSLFGELGRRRAIPFPLFCDEGVGRFVQRVDEARRGGRLGAGERRLADQTLVEALMALRDDPHARDVGNGIPARPIAVVGSLEGDGHPVGSLCVRLLLERRGWTVLYLGPDVPAEHFPVLHRSREADLTCVACSDPTTGADLSRRFRALLGAGTGGRCWAVAFGGDGEPERRQPGATTDGAEAACFSGVRGLNDALDRDGGSRRFPVGAHS